MKLYIQDRLSPVFAESNAAQHSRQILRKVSLELLPPGIRAELVAECGHLARVNSPNIVSYTVVRIDEASNALYLAHEYSEARSLADLVRGAAARASTVGERVLERVLAGTRLALEALRSRLGPSYAHGHICLENIIISRDNSIQLADYALGRIYGLLRQSGFRREYTFPYDVYPDRPATLRDDMVQLHSLLGYVMSYGGVEGSYSEAFRASVEALRSYPVERRQKSARSSLRDSTGQPFLDTARRRPISAPTAHTLRRPGVSECNIQQYILHRVPSDDLLDRPQNYDVSLLIPDGPSHRRHSEASISMAGVSSPRTEGIEGAAEVLVQEIRHALALRSPTDILLLEADEELKQEAFSLALRSKDDLVVAEILLTLQPFQDGIGRTGLMYGVIYDSIAVVKHWTPAQCGLWDKDGHTALTHAILLNRPYYVRMLARYEAKCVGPNGLLPIDLAKQLQMPELVKIIALVEDLTRARLPTKIVRPLSAGVASRRVKASSSIRRHSFDGEARAYPTELEVDPDHSPLIAAILAGTPNGQILGLIPQYARRRDPNGTTALYTALERGMLEISMALAPYELLLRGRDGDFPLELALRKGMQQLALDLLDAARESIGELLWLQLRASVEENRLDQLGRLCATAQSPTTSQSPPSGTSQRRATPILPKDQDAITYFSSLGRARTSLVSDSVMHLINAVRGRNLKAVKQNLQYVRKRDSQGWTALMHAAALPFPEAIPFLESEYGMVVPDTGKTALMIAASAGCVDVVRSLLNHEARAVSREGKSALVYSMERSHYPCAQLLAPIEAGLWGADFDSPLIYAVRHTKIPYALLCIPGGCGAQDANGETALMHAIKQGMRKLALRLAEHEAGLKNRAGETALMYCIRFAQLEVARALAPAEANICDPNGRYPLQLAEETRQASFIKLLVRYTRNL
ncbi:Kinase, NEK [Giardia muris]|uniref:Kinase, NEK n=1 Tax=Giardia muris TaxID=5742 RepID=A0A4Z1T5H0_GIAMU|nr:Kinase, NEK [Giardia muris]|eukprot:TNJ27769.1 Kinase, NEK [Giardia muris]